MRGGAPTLVWAFAIAFVAIEIVLSLSDTGVLVRGLRPWAYTHFGFFAGRFEAAQSGQLVPLSFYLTFVSHAFLHGGFVHLFMNTAIFLALGAHLGRAVGALATILLFLGTAVGGALAFGLLTPTDQQFIPMVGASGGIFGLFGAMKRWEWRFVTRHGLPRRRFWTTILVLVGINLVLAIGSAGVGGGVAWEAHLGGFIAGWLAAGALTPRPGTSVGPL